MIDSSRKNEIRKVAKSISEASEKFQLIHARSFMDKPFMTYEQLLDKLINDWKHTAGEFPERLQDIVLQINYQIT